MQSPAGGMQEDVSAVTGIENGRPLLDGASACRQGISPEFDAEKRIVSDTGRPIEERLEAFENIIDSEVGDTNLVRARNLERVTGVRQIYLKFDGNNPTGTQKDRIAFAQAMDALRRGFDAITTATCGNYGAATALAASYAGLRCHIFLPEQYKTKRMDEMTALGALLVRSQGDYEHAVSAAREFAAKHDVYDANPGGPNTTLQLKAYGEIAYEIYDELRDAPYAVAVPVSNGTTLAGIYRGFLSLYRRGKTSRMPMFVAGSAHRKNPIVYSYLKNIDTCQSLDPARIKETAVNEPLINWFSIDGQQALEAIRESGGRASWASDKAMLWYARLLREQEGLSVLPASTAGLIALLEGRAGSGLPNDRFVAVLTGRK